MKKTLTSLVLALILVFSLLTVSACGEKTPLEGDDALAAYHWVNEQMSAVKAFDAAMTMDVTMAGETTSSEMAMKVDSTGEDIKLWVSADVEGIGMEYTYVDGIVYMLMSMEGMTMKMKSSSDESIAPFKELANSFNEEDEAEVITSAEFVKKEENKYVIKVVYDAETAIQDVYDSLGVTDIEELGAALTDVQGSVIYECDAKGMVSKMTMELSYKLDGELTTTKDVMTLTNPGVIPTITVPADADQYVDADSLE